MKLKLQQNRDTGRLKSEKTDEKTSVCFFVGAWVSTTAYNVPKPMYGSELLMMGRKVARNM
jgi:hypothetical protein